MPRSLRLCSLLLALSLGWPALWPSEARAASNDPTNEIVAFGLLGAVVGILVYVGWKMDKEDQQYFTEHDDLRRAVADTGTAGQLRLISPGAREGEHITGLGYEFVF
jgi:hypothetical protein